MRRAMPPSWLAFIAALLPHGPALRDSLEEAAQMLEAYAAHVRGLSKDGWYADDASNPGEDWYELSRDLK